MLVNTHKHVFISILFIGWNIVQAQEVWTIKQCIDTAQVHNKNLQINRNNISISDTPAPSSLNRLLTRYDKASFILIRS